MSATRKNTAILGLRVAPRAACCAGPIIGVPAAIGLGKAAGAAMFGTFALMVGAGAVGIVLLRRRRSRDACAPPDPTSAVSVEPGAARITR